jgi:hypothetical protein
MRDIKTSFCTFLHLYAISSPTRTNASFAVFLSYTLSSYITSLTLPRTFSILAVRNSNNFSAGDCFLFQVNNT